MIAPYAKGLNDEEYLKLRDLVIYIIEQEDTKRGIE